MKPFNSKVRHLSGQCLQVEAHIHSLPDGFIDL
jgi:hypothetical protein